jgi:hypothetical protein
MIPIDYHLIEVVLHGIARACDAVLFVLWLWNKIIG